MALLSLAAVVFMITLVVVAAFMIPAFVEIRKTASATREFLDRFESDLKPVMEDLRASLSDLKTITQETSAKSEQIHSFMDALGDTGKNLRTINNVVGTVAGTMATSSLWITGTKAAGKFFIEKLLSRKGR